MAVKQNTLKGEFSMEVFRAAVERFVFGHIHMWFLQILCGFFDKIRGQYQEVVKHIDHASNLGTTKSAMFEDIDNMLSQIPPIIEDYNSK